MECAGEDGGARRIRDLLRLHSTRFAHCQFHNSAGLATNPIGPEPVVSLNYDSTAWDGTNAGGPIAPITLGRFRNPGASLFVTPRNLVTPYAQNWNLNVSNNSIQPQPCNWATLEAKAPSWFVCAMRISRNVNGTRNNFPQYGPVDEFATISASVYHALQATLRTRNWHGLSGFTGYTFSKSLDDASDGIDFNFATVAFPQDSNNLAAERGPSNFDTRHRLTVAFTYQLPEFGGPKRLTAGWQLNTIITAQSGRPCRS